MAKCDVCKKTSLLPEKFGTINVCKICFMKANGPFWKHQYDRYDDAEKHRCKAIEAAQKQNFPQNVIDAINDYFSEQMNSMLVCDCCGTPVQHLQPLKKSNICKECYNKINNSAWKATEYDDNEEVEKNREKLLKIAAKNRFPELIIDDINAHFNSKIQKGLLFSVDGDEGQKLKVFKDHCVLITDEDEFDADDVSIRYAQALKSGQPKESWISRSDAASLARSALSKGIVKTGINLATSAVINSAVDKYVPEKANFRVKMGDITIDYHTYTYVERQKVGNNDIGFIRFTNNNSSGELCHEALFFFNDDTDKLDEAYKAVCEGINASARSTVQESQRKVPQPSASSATSVADEILKFKQLLDMGAITQEEFDAKKKELLGL